jgi:fructokinase
MTAGGADEGPRGDRVFGGVEAGGTKVICVVGSGPGAILDECRIEVTDPVPTLGAVVDFLRAATRGGRRLDAIGVASFGPVELRRDHPDFGRITATPKPRWAGTDMIGPFAAAFGVPVGFDTDVNAAALAEGHWGAARGLDTYVYLTIGTGIGGGVVADGRLVGGLGHPEVGHMAVPRQPGDAFEGSCPFHGDCLEGLASGPAVGRRFGRRAELLEGADQAAAAALVGFYLAAVARALISVMAPQRIVVGGGLAGLPGLFEATRTELPRQLAGYPGLPEHAATDFIVPAGLGGMAGPCGALLLARRAVETPRPDAT